MPGEMKHRSDGENQALERLYQYKQPSAEHTAAEAGFNREREKRLREDGFQGEYKPVRDARFEFQFDEKRDVQGRLIETTASSTGPLRPPEEVVNWRDTKVGLKADQDARAKYHGSGDDGGHLISPAFGADPGDPRNLSKQNFVTNQYGNFKKFENDCKSTVANHPEPHELQVHVRYKQDGEEEREFTRHMQLSRRDANGQPQAVKELDFMNPETQASRAAKAGGKADRTGDRELHREVRAEAKRFNPESLTPEDRQQMRENMRKHAIDGGFHKSKQR
jgi:hypothetical protein